MSVLTRVTWHNIPEDGILHSHCRENLQSYIFFSLSLSLFIKNSNLVILHINNKYERVILLSDPCPLDVIITTTTTTTEAFSIHS
jgi:hypothetical protein